MGRGSSKVGNVVDMGGGGYQEAYTFFNSPPPEKGMYGQWDGALTEKEEKAVSKYTGSAYVKMNAELRKGSDGIKANGKKSETVAGIDSAIDKFTLTKDIKVYRGSSADMLGGFTSAEDINKNLKGGTVQDLAFISTSTSKNAAFGGSIAYEITVKKGKGKGAFIAPKSHFSNESEFLLKRGTKFKIKGAREEGSGYNKKTIVELEC